MIGMGHWFSTQAATGSLALAVPVALIAGLVSFFSPCVLPLLPGYLSYATGLSGADLASGAWERRHGHWRTLPAFEGSLRGIVSRPPRAEAAR